MSTAKPKHMLRKCNHCFATAAEKKLMFCTQCKAQTYCSRECQKADWKNHKGACKNNNLLESRLREYENTPRGQLDRLFLVDGLSLHELDQRLERWVRFHSPTLMAATIHALRLPEDVGRARTSLLYVRLEARPQPEHEGATGKFFRVRDAEVVAWDDACRRPSPWPESLEQLRVMQDEAGRMGHGGVAAAMVECEPLAVQTVPFGSMMNFREKVQEDWKPFFIAHIEQGLRPRMVR
ncbi:hypothetical protein PYCCODRAFT_1440668 [Trametes coccinea BRFM310]|uniref:MYND-type domain-containing protein n=1 Tax=Trametes coccinea (strain BRFM310) TaxID=1353009 RepID=A0A1Y2I739_TRAC3|nr:hypothetical protein PYCCODRAFT_1440668 [Trametes coccinea BRFM310]